MSGDYCRGCGVAIQSEDPGKPGYVPSEVKADRNRLICKRCYRITHYGEASKVQPEPNKIRQSIIKAISLSDLLVIVVDLADITGTLPVWSGFLNEKPYILAVNKSDLLPVRTKQPEIIDFLKLYLKNNGWGNPRDLIMTSGLKGGGIDILAGRIGKETAAGSRVAILGVTNVGKSSVVKQFLKSEKSANAPTVSKFPGTTMGLSNWSILKGRNTLIDTPGLVPGDRMSDLLCPECACLLVPSTKIEQKLWGLNPGKGLIVGGLLGVEYLGAEETVVIAFTSPEITLHRTDNLKIPQLMDESPAWLNKTCRSCRNKVEWQEEIVNLPANHDLAVAGLGWISLRGRATNEFKIRLPKGIRWEIRPVLIGKR